MARSAREVGALLRARRRALGLSQAVLGQRTGLRQPTISAVESGAPGTRLRTVFDLLAALELELVVRPRTKGSAKEIGELF